MKSYNNVNLWITLIFIWMKYLPSADSLQCFECENCPTIGENGRDYLKECTPLESFSTQGPASTTTFISSTNKEGIVITSSESAQNSTPSSSSVGVNTNSTNTSGSLPSSTSTLSSLNKTETTKSSVESTTEKQKVTSSWDIFPNSIEENELNNLKPELEDRSDELFSWRSRQVNEVCYVLKLNYEGNEITKRGCGLRGQDKDQTCEILSKGEPNSQCEVCEGNLCNSGSRFRTGFIGLLLILFILKAYF